MKKIEWTNVGKKDHCMHIEWQISKELLYLHMMAKLISRFPSQNHIRSLAFHKPEQTSDLVASTTQPGHTEQLIGQRAML